MNQRQAQKVAVQDHLRFLADQLGPRPAGSAPYHESAAYIRQVMQDCGLQLEEIQFECIDWQHKSTMLEVDGEQLPAFANIYSPACDVTAAMVAVCTPAELEAANISDKIVIFYGDLIAAPIIPLNCQVYNTDRDQRINQLLLERKPAAVITVNLRPPAVDSLIEDADQFTPSATVAAQVGLKLLKHIGETAHLKIDAQRIPAQATTIIGRKPGPTPAKITLMAHYDTKIDTPGAWDNASGVAAMLALVETLTGQDLPIGLEFIAFGDEEYYAYSDGMYVEKHGAQMPNILAAINLDFIGHTLGANSVAIFAESEGFKESVDSVLAEFPAMVWADPWPQSNHSTFAYRGVPALALCSNGTASITHQPSDTIDWISAEKLDEVVRFVQGVITAIQDQPVGWTRP